MYHVWKTDKKTYFPEWFSDDACKAMSGLNCGKSRAFRKIDGSCGAIMRDNSSSPWKVYQRYDNRKGKYNEPFPVSFIPIPDKKGCDYLLREISKDDKNMGSLYDSINTTEAKLDKNFYSVELVGNNFNKTPGVVNNWIAIHEHQKVLVDFPCLTTIDEWFDWMKDYFTTHHDEGLVIEHNGCYWKIHGSKFCPNLHKKSYELPVLL